VQRFLAGFVTASVVWGGLLFAHRAGWVDLGITPKQEEAVASAAPSEADDDPAQPNARKRKGKGKGSGGQSKRPHLIGDSTTGDDLGGPEQRELNAANQGGEEQLLGTEIERGFDGVFPQIRRCLMLAAGEDEVSGKLVFGLRIEGSGGVTRVNLAGPSAITQGEAGDCLRKAARSIAFRRFNGPDMLVHYPVTLQ
jgi:hypothetical protein